MRSRRKGMDLDERQLEVLRVVLREHIQNGEPVGSVTVAQQSRLRLSPASIRSVMADLQEGGWLARPHASAGTVPTDRTYRLYVDQLVRAPRVGAAQAEAIDQALQETQDEVGDLLGEASRQLSHFSNRMGIVLAPTLDRVVVEHLEFVHLDAGRAVAILVGRSGVVHHRVLRVDEPLAQAEFDRIGRQLSEQLGGRTLAEMRALLEQRLAQQRAAYDRWMKLSLELGRRALDAVEPEAEVFVDGMANLLELPEFADLDVTRALLRALDEKRRLIGLLSQMLETEGVQVLIGEENPVSGLSRCSLVVSTYRGRGQVLGTVGIVGPTRMRYARTIGLVDYLARALSRHFSGPGC